MPLNPDLYKIGKLSLLTQPHTELIATVNHFDNFKLWAAPIIDEAITDALAKAEAFEEWGEYLGYSTYHPHRNPAVIEIAREIYNHFRQQD